MPDSVLFTFENALNRATLIQAPLMNSRLRLLQNFTPTAATNRTQLLAAEANFTGYPTGGYNLGNWTGPGLSSGGAGVITAPTQVIANTNASCVSNSNLTGWWIEANGTLTGNVPLTVTTGIWNPARQATQPTDQFPFIVQDFEGLVSAPG